MISSDSRCWPESFAPKWCFSALESVPSVIHSVAGSSSAASASPVSAVIAIRLRETTWRGLVLTPAEISCIRTWFLVFLRVVCLRARDPLASGGSSDLDSRTTSDRPIVRMRESHRMYLHTIAQFISWVHDHGYSVRLLIGDMHYDNPVVDEFVGLLAGLGIATQEPLLMVQPALTVADVLRQIAETELVISARYHNLVMALIQGKPVMALSDHAKLDSLVSDFGLARYRIPLADLNAETLIERFKELESELDRLKPYVRAGVDRYRQALDGQYASLLGQRRIDAPTERLAQ